MLVIFGQVIDENGVLINGVSVVVVYVLFGMIFISMMDSIGLFNFCGFCVGGFYMVKVDVKGFVDYIVQDILLMIGDIVVVLIKFELVVIVVSV